jgi:hypothetical protein
MTVRESTALPEPVLNRIHHTETGSVQRVLSICRTQPYPKPSLSATLIRKLTNTNTSTSSKMVLELSQITNERFHQFQNGSTQRKTPTKTHRFA